MARGREALPGEVGEPKGVDPFDDLTEVQRHADAAEADPDE